MAKQRRTNTSVSAIGSLLETIGAVAKVELKNNPEELAKVDKMVADVKDSNLTTALECQDDSIEAMHTAEEQAELAAAGIPPVIEAEVNEPAALPEPNEKPPLEN